MYKASKGTPGHKQLLWFWYKASVFWKGRKDIKSHVSFKQQSHRGMKCKGWFVVYVVEWGQVSRENNVKEVDSWSVRENSSIIHGCHTKTNHSRLWDLLQYMYTDRKGCVHIPCAKTVTLHLEASRCSRQTFSLRPWAWGSWTDMCHRQLSTWSTLHHQIGKCFVYLYLSMFGTLKHETRARNHLSWPFQWSLSCCYVVVLIKKLK